VTSKKKLRKALRFELELHWDALAHAVRMAVVPGTWTIGCENHADAIRRISALVGPTNWTAVPTSLLLDGTYQRLSGEMGYDGPEFTPDLDYIADLEQWASGTRTTTEGE
jgi:hypothetical protein